MRDKKADEISKLVHNHEVNVMGAERYSVDAQYKLADQIMALFTVPPIKLPCGECGGTSELECTYCSEDESCVCGEPCTCKEGEREWRVMMVQLPEHEGATGWEKPLHATDLFDPDVAWAYRALIITPNIETCDIPNNKGKLVLREVE